MSNNVRLGPLGPEIEVANSVIFANLISSVIHAKTQSHIFIDFPYSFLCVSFFTFSAHNEYT